MTRFLSGLVGIPVILLGIWRLAQFEPSQTPTVEQLLGDADLAEIRQVRSLLDAEPDTLLLLITGGEERVDPPRLTSLVRQLQQLEDIAHVVSLHDVLHRPAAVHAAATIPSAAADTATLLIATLAADVGRLNRARKLALDVDGVLRQWSQPGERILWAGSAYVRAQTWSIARQDMRLLLPLLIAALVVVPLLFFGTLRAVLLPLFVAVVSTVLTLELARWWGLQLNALVMLVVPFIWAVSTLNVFHLLDRVQVRFHEGVLDPVAAARAELLLPCLLTSLTTAGGCAVLALQQQSPLLQAFGTWAGIGTVLAFVVSFSAAGLFVPSGTDRNPPFWPWRFCQHLVRYSQRHAGWIILIWAALLSAGIVGSLRISQAAPYPQVFAAGVPVGDELREIAALINTDLSPLELYLTPSDEQGQRPAATLAAALSLADYVRGFEETRLILPVDAMGTLQPPAGQKAIPAAVDPMGHLERMATALEQEESLREWVNLQRGVVRLQLHLQPTTLARKRQIIEWLLHFDHTMLSHHRLHLSGPGYLYPRLEHQGLNAAMMGALLSLLLVMVVLAGAFGTRAHFWMAVIGNLAPLVMAAGVMGAVGIPWSLALLPVPAVLLALGVDDTLHLLWPSRGREQTIDSSLELGARRSGSALLATTVVLCTCIAALCTSGLQANHHIALLLPTGLVAALACDLTLLPALLTVWSRRSFPHRR